MITVSIVVPVYSGENYIERLVGEIQILKDRLAAEHAPFSICEAIFVDDAAKDGSAAVLDRLAAQHEWVRAIHLSRNFGQHPATIAGILYTSGDWIVTMDEDLQHPPAKIPELFVPVAQSGADIVYAAPEGQIHQSAARDMTSRGYKFLIEWLTGNSDIRKVNSFRLIRGEIARGASSICGHDTYFDVALAWYTKRIHAVKMVLKDERYIQTKKSGYNFRSLLSHARRLAASSQIKVLRMGALLGIVVLALSVLLSLILLILKLVAGSVVGAQGWTSIMLAISFFSGIILLMSGIMLEYLSILVLRAHGKPLFFAIDRSGDAPLVTYFTPK